MNNIPVKEIAFILVMAVLLLIVAPIFQSRTGKDLLEILFGIRRKKKDGPAVYQ